MSIAAHASSTLQATAKASRAPAHFWTVLLILLAIDIGVVAAAVYVGVPPLDPSVIGP